MEELTTKQELRGKISTSGKILGTLISQKGEKGDKGPQGEKGSSFIWKGNYNSSNTYQVNDAVFYLGSSYICVKESTGNTPTNSEYFNLMAKQGESGSGTGTGDMLKAIYDIDGDGVVDNALKIDGHTVKSDVPSDAKFTDTQYTAGEGIEIDENNVIKNVQNAAEWGKITGDLSEQTDLKKALDNKVSVVEGKGLSSNDYSNDEKTKLEGIEEGAKANVKANWNSTEGDSEILNKPNVIDNLESTSSTDILSAKQGKVLKEKIEETGGWLLTGSIVAYDGDTIPEGYEEVDGKSLIHCYGSSYTLTSSNSETIPLTNYSVKRGDGFTVQSNGKVLVNREMYAKIKGQIALSASANGAKLFQIFVNGSEKSYQRVGSLAAYNTIQTDASIQHLNVGDVINMAFLGANGDKTLAGSHITFMSLEEV